MNTLVDWLLSLTPHGAPFFDTYAWLINTAIYTTVTALFIILFKLIFKNKIKARWHFLIWAILLIRLVVPDLPSAPISVFNAVRVEESVIEHSSYQTIVTPPNTPADDPDSQYPVAQAPHSESNGFVSFTEGDKPGESVTILNTDRIVLCIWLGGTVILLGYFITVLAVYRRRLKKRRSECDEKTLSILNACKEKLGIKRNVRLYFADTTPVLIGLFKPSIYIPDNYSESELEAVIIHELCHMKHLDVLWSGVAAAVLCLNWYNPIIWVSFFMFKRDIEVYCDERTLKYLDDKQSYAMLLLKTAAKNKYVFGTSSLQSGKSDVKRRIRYLAKFKKPKVLIIIIAVILAALISVVCLTNATAITQSDEFSYEKNAFTQTLTIKGSGQMPDYELEHPPWYNVTKPINIKVENGITSLSANSLSGDIDGNTGKPRNDFQYTERVELPNTLKNIGSFAFLNCLSLQEINLPESLTEIDEGAFKKCKSLKEITLPEGVTDISNALFDECESLESVKLSSKTKKIGYFAFSNTALTEIELPDTVETIEEMAFYDCKFKSVTIPKSVVLIEENAFGYGDDENYRISKIKDFTIKGYEGTAAEKYAEINGFNFESMGQVESYSEWVSEVINTQISDYYIETDSQTPLKATKTDDFSTVISIINTMGHINPDFTLYDLSQIDNNLYFRKTASEEKQYYCIIEDTEFHDKAYLFFNDPDGFWICRDYIALDEDGDPFDMRNGSESLEADNGASLLNLIAEVDK